MSDTQTQTQSGIKLKWGNRLVAPEELPQDQFYFLQSPCEGLRDNLVVPRVTGREVKAYIEKLRKINPVGWSDAALSSGRIGLEDGSLPNMRYCEMRNRN
ncbi:hypothetical protein J4233_05550 [Candidatus Pacearchaeota archaeon]|nr:hypothetical protein [uncultured archaeon]AQS28906.1 hypothetical protein [uncultured archaeon]MBS3077704.1 hypothetical protein [Candidatus Pacearchaeota archaeon]